MLARNPSTGSSISSDIISLHPLPRNFWAEKEGLGKKKLLLAIVPVDGFSSFSYQALLEPLQVLNSITGQNLVEIIVASSDGLPVKASDGIFLEVDMALNDIQRLDMVVLCGGHKSEGVCCQKLLNWLRLPSIRKLNVGAVDSACLSLMKSGLLDGFKCTIHWRFFATASELYPHMDIQQSMIEFDRNRFTGAGGVSILNLVIDITKLVFGEAAARDLAIHYNFDVKHYGSEIQRKQRSYHAVNGNARLNRALEYINENLENSIDTDSIANVSGLSKRQMERHFKKHLGISPGMHVVKMRLMKAVDLLIGTESAITDIAFACGFNSSTHFSKKFKEYFGMRPRDIRSTGEYPAFLTIVEAV